MISIKKRIICSIRRNKRDKKVSTPTAGAFTIWKCANVAGGSGKQEILVVMPGDEELVERGIAMKQIVQ